jgi:hypothetical protein
MAKATQERAVNLQAYQRLKEKLGLKFGHGRFVAICDGRVVADAGTFSGLRRRLVEMGEDPSEALIVQADADYPEHAVIFGLSLGWSKPFWVTPVTQSLPRPMRITPTSEDWLDYPCCA